MSHMVKITKQRKQCSITVPRKLAIKTGLDKAKYAWIRINEKGRLEVEKFEGKKEEKGDL